MGRVFGAFVFAPFIGVGLIGMVLRSMDGGMAAVLVAYPIALIFGLPMFLLFRRQGWFRWWQAVLGCTICALPFIALYLLIAAPEHVSTYGLRNSLAFLGFGAVVGVIFWAIGIAGNSALTTRP